MKTARVLPVYEFLGVHTSVTQEDRDQHDDHDLVQTMPGPVTTMTGTEKEARPPLRPGSDTITTPGIAADQHSRNGWGRGDDAALSGTIVVPEIADDATNLDAALAYAGSGLYLVPTLRANPKHPGSILGKSWQTKSSRDTDHLVAWYAGSDSGIYVHAGRSGLVVLDVDHPGLVPKWMWEYLDHAPYQSTRPGEDPRRGHYLFSVPAGRTLGNGTGRLGSGWGDVRGLNGGIVVAPSRHPGGGRYEWRRTGPVPVLPGEIADKLDDATEAEDAVSDGAVSRFIEDTAGHNERPGLISAHVKWLHERIEQGGSRHDTTVKAMVWAAEEAAAGFFPFLSAFDQIRDIFISAVQLGTGQRTATRAVEEFDGIVAWAVGQALVCDVEQVRARVAERMPDDTEPEWWRNVAQDGAAETFPSSWQPINLSQIVTGERECSTPTMMRREDGQCLIYEGKSHSFHGESESGKSLVVQAECVNLISTGRKVLYLDFEDDEDSVIERLQALGASNPDILAHFTYVHPEVKPVTPEDKAALAALLSRQYALVVIDGVTNALAVFGFKTNENDDLAVFGKKFVEQIIRRTGAATAQVDHVVKDKTNQGRFAIGGQHKMAGLSGAAYTVEVVEPLGRGLRGVIDLRIGKDRPGSIRGRCGKFRKGDRTQPASRVVVDSTGDRTVVTFGDHNGGGGSDVFRPTNLMERVSRTVEGSAEPMSKRAAVEQTIGNQASKQTAFDVLVNEGYFERANAVSASYATYRSAKPYREESDPLVDVGHTP